MHMWKLRSLLMSTCRCRLLQRSHSSANGNVEVRMYVLVPTVISRPNTLPNGTLSTLDAGLGTLVSQAPIGHTVCNQLRSSAQVRNHLIGLDLSSALRVDLIIAGESQRLVLLQCGNHTRRAEFCFWEIFQSFAAFQLCVVAENIWQRFGEYSGRINSDRGAYCYTNRRMCLSSTSGFDTLERSLHCTIRASPAMQSFAKKVDYASAHCIGGETN